jgi:hypothetical protein
MGMDAAQWQAHRRYLFAVAYRLLGTVSRAGAWMLPSTAGCWPRS